MRHADLPDTPLASYRPDLAGEIDTLADQLREAIAPYVPAGQRPAAFAAIDQVIEGADIDGRQASAAGRMQVVFETLRAIYGDTRLPSDVRRKAVAAAIGANDPYFSESYQHYADQFAVTRACVHSNARDVQKRLGVRARRDKSDSARATSQARATGPRRPRAAPCTAVQPKTLRSVFTFFPGL